jgi:hypothetical protein
MKKLFWIAALLFAASHVPAAYADSYTYTAVFTCDPTITCTSVPLPVTDIMFPNATFNVTWDNTVFSVDLPASWAPTDSITWNAVLCLPTCSSLEPVLSRLQLHDTTVPGNIGIFTDHFPIITTLTNASDQGSLTFIPTPEPSSVYFVLGAAVILLVMRKSMARLIHLTI